MLNIGAIDASWSLRLHLTSKLQLSNELHVWVMQQICVVICKTVRALQLLMFLCCLCCALKCISTLMSTFRAWTCASSTLTARFNMHWINKYVHIWIQNIEITHLIVDIFFKNWRALRRRKIGRRCFLVWIFVHLRRRYEGWAPSWWKDSIMQQNREFIKRCGCVVVRHIHWPSKGKLFEGQIWFKHRGVPEPYVVNQHNRL